MGSWQQLAAAGLCMLYGGYLIECKPAGSSLRAALSCSQPGQRATRKLGSSTPTVLSHSPAHIAARCPTAPAEQALQALSPGYDLIQTQAYALSRLLACYAASSTIYRELAARMPDFRPKMMLDYGAGPGTSIWAAQEVGVGAQGLLLCEDGVCVGVWVGGCGWVWVCWGPVMRML